jgi:glycosyltransferase involved in cell wall biosynthesis
MTSLDGVRVCMFVRNSFEFDARVEREATALASEGARVTVVALWDPDRTRRRETRGPIRIRRVRRFFGLIDLLRAAWLRTSRPESGGPRERTAITSGLDAMQRTWSKARKVSIVERLRDAMIALRMAAVGLDARADVYHAHDLNTLAAASWCARARGAQLVYDSHEISPGLPSVRDPVAVIAFERSLIGRADAVIHTTPMRAAWAADTYGIPMPTVIRNVPERHADVAPVDLGAAAEFPTGIRVILHQGFMSPDRGLEALVEAMASLDGFGLLLLGGGRLRPALERLVGDRALADRVRFRDAVPHQQLLGWTAGAWCGASLLVDTCLNHRYSLPNKLFEYLAAGVPLIASANEEIAAFLEVHGCGELCDPSDPASIADAVKRLDARYAQVAAAARRAGERFRWENEEASLLEVYERVLGGISVSAAGAPRAGS